MSAELCTNLHASEGRYSCQCPPRHVGIGRQPPGCVTDARRIFLSSKTWDGNLGGVLGAARKCQALADAAGLGGIWAAWLSSSRSDVKTRLPSARYVRAHDHKTVADSRDDLLDGTLAIAIDVDEKGNTHLDRETEVWTGSLADGTNEPGGMTCNDWTDGTSGYKARGGKASQKDPIEGKSNWSWATAPYCSEKHRLICFER